MNKIVVYNNINDLFDPAKCKTIRTNGDDFAGNTLGKSYRNVRFENTSEGSFCSYSNCTFAYCLFYRLAGRVLQFDNCVFDECMFVDPCLGEIDYNGCAFNSTSFVVGEYHALDVDFRECNISHGGFLVHTPEGQALTWDNALRYVKVLLSGCRISDYSMHAVQSENVIVRDSLFTKTSPSDNPTYLLPVCPTEGSFIAYKKAVAASPDRPVDVIIKLKVSENARRFSGVGRKCRCDSAEVLDIYSLDKGAHFKMARSRFMFGFVYTVGKTVTEPDFDESPKICSRGIHFFMSEAEAANYEG